MRLAAAILTLPLLFPAAAGGDAVVDAVNDARADHGLPPLTVSVRLERSATALARRLMREQRFDHEPVRPPGFGLYAEALLLDFSERARPADAVDTWMESPEHRRVLLTRTMRYVGAGVSRGDFEGERATLRVLQVGRPSARSRPPSTRAR
ncbi:MAG TPA: CAP domain-containing protein [Solirubrobacter sp.]|jgi:uncharacterized protein YkwD|nr:CAP domain-containing protein [Solirubrobacter sp.]